MSAGRQQAPNMRVPNWVFVNGFNFSCHNKKTILFTVDPYYGNLIINFLEPL